MGIVWIVIASALFSVMGLCVKLGGRWFGTAELVFYRSLFGLAGMSLILLARRRSIATPFLSWHLGRGLAGAVALLCFFYAIAHLPLGSAMSLNYTSPLFLAVYLGAQQRRWPSPGLLASLLLGFIGVWLLLRPSFAGFSPFAVLIGLASGALAGFAYLAVSRLGRAGEPPERVVWYFTLVSLAVSLVWGLREPWRLPEGRDAWLVLLGLGASATAAQFALTQAYRHGPTLAVACLAYSTVLFSGLLEHLIGQASWNAQTLGAQALIALSGLAAILTRHRGARPATGG